MRCSSAIRVSLVIFKEGNSNLIKNNSKMRCKINYKSATLLINNFDVPLFLLTEKSV